MDEIVESRFEEFWARSTVELRSLRRFATESVELKEGKISLIEWRDGTLRRFDQMDLNRDGTVTSEERETYRSGRAVPAPAPTPLIPLSKGD